MQSTNSIAPAPRRCPAPRHGRQSSPAWGNAKKSGSGPRTSSTTGHNKPPARCTSAAAHAGTAPRAPASAESAAAPAQAWEPGSRAKKALSTPAAGTFFVYALRPRFPLDSGTRVSIPRKQSRPSDFFLKKSHTEDSLHGHVNSGSAQIAGIHYRPANPGPAQGRRIATVSQQAQAASRRLRLPDTPQSDLAEFFPKLSNIEQIIPI